MADDRGLMRSLFLFPLAFSLVVALTSDNALGEYLSLLSLSLVLHAIDAST